MLGRDTYTVDELANARTSVEHQLANSATLAEAAPADPSHAFSATLFNTVLVALDRPFVHRVLL